MTSYRDYSDFQHLDPNTFIESIGDAIGEKMSGICRPYTSYINRVYELQTDGGKSCVVKFYRPGRWKKEMLVEEHQFLLELQEAEIPVIAPLVLKSDSSLGDFNGIHFAVFEKKGGRTIDELSTEDWLEVGRLLGRVHQVGKSHPAHSRVVWSPDQATRSHIASILKGDFISGSLSIEYQKVTDALIELATPLFKEASFQRIHGDLHFANLIFRPDESFFMIDFDDMCMGPAVQDMWMLLPGHRDETQREIGLLAEGYELFQPFPYNELKLIEILRGMRYIHYSAWCAHQVKDGGFLIENEHWGTEAYWQEQIDELHRQLQRIHSELSLLS